MSDSEKKNKRNGIIGTILFHALLLVAFLFMGLTYRIPPPPEEGITINFGYQDFGSGSEQPEQIVEEQEITPQEIVNNNPVVEDPKLGSVASIFIVGSGVNDGVPVGISLPVVTAVPVPSVDLGFPDI